MQGKPSFLITIDTEGDNLWSRTENKITTKNASYLPRFQELCERYKLKPTYLTNFEMANSSQFQEFGKEAIQRDVAEIGMHLHAWDMPPSFQLTENDLRFHPYLIEYPVSVMRDKVKFMTDLLEDVFGTKMLSHRAGRWSFDERYAQCLIENGYKVDCSVTPHVSWKDSLGDPSQSGGTDYTSFPDKAYFIDTSDISRSGDSTLLEVPVSTNTNRVVNALASSSIVRNLSLARRGLYYAFPRIYLRPKHNNLKQMLGYLKHAASTKREYVEFMLHSSELMPGGSPYFKSESSIEKLYDTLDILFDNASQHFAGCTLSEYYEIFTRQNDENSRGSKCCDSPRSRAA